MAIRGTFFSHYSRRGNKRYTLTRNNLESGMMIEVLYKPKDKPVKNYIGILLHKGFDSHGSTKLHFLTVEDMQPRHFDGFVEQVGLEYSTYFKNVRKLTLSKLLTEEKGAQKFYIMEIRDELDGMFKNAYRTFLTTNITSTRVLDYKFDV